MMKMFGYLVQNILIDLLKENCGVTCQFFYAISSLQIGGWLIVTMVNLLSITILINYKMTI